MYTEIALGDDLTLRVEEGEDSACYLLTLLVGDNERMGLTLSNSDALVNWIHRSIALCMSSEILELSLIHI